jgi:uncharacterized protein YndB with AHSA1/START domain
LAVATIALRVSRQPSEFRIVRSVEIAAAPKDVFEFVNDFHRWRAWSPWATLDPHMSTQYDGPHTGVGSSYAWTGNKKVGAGKMTITEAQADRRVALELQFLKPIKATNAGEFVFDKVTSGTRVTWSMTGRNGFMGKLFAFFVDTDKMVGGDFEKGLAALKALAEAKPPSLNA